MPFHRSIGNRKPLGCFISFIVVFITLKLIVFKKISEFFNFTVYVLFA